MFIRRAQVQTAVLRLPDRLLVSSTTSRHLTAIPLHQTSSSNRHTALVNRTLRGGRGATTWLTHPHLSVRQLTLPFQSDAEIAAVLPESLQQEWPTDEPYVWGTKTLGRDREGTRVLVAGLSTAQWNDWIGQWHALGLDPDSVQLMGLSAWEAWHAQPDVPTAPHALLHLEPDAGLLIHGTATRIIGVYPVLPYPSDPAGHTAWERHLARILIELQARQGASATCAILGICGSQVPTELVQTLAHALPIPVRHLFPLQTNTSWPPIHALVSPVATGLEFRTGAQMSAAAVVVRRRRQRTTLTVIIGLILAILGTVGWQAWDRIERYAALTEATETLVQELIPGQHPADPVQHVKAEIQARRLQLNQLQRDPWKATDALMVLSATLPDTGTLTIRELLLTPTLLVIDGTVPTFAALDELRTALQAMPRAKSLSATNAASAQAQNVPFRLTIQLHPEESP